jgi:cytochrome c556
LAVQNEMRLLLEALRNTVTAIAMSTLETIPGSLQSVDHARELTEKAVESGEYKLPKNGDKLAEFKELDEAFHGELAKLVAASQSKNAQATATQLGVVLSKCDGCHTQYRR